MKLLLCNNVLFLFNFRISDNCGVKKRMKHSSTKEILPKKLNGAKSIQANDKGDLDFETVVNDLRKAK